MILQVTVNKEQCALWGLQVRFKLILSGSNNLDTIIMTKKTKNHSTTTLLKEVSLAFLNQNIITLEYLFLA